MLPTRVPGYHALQRRFPLRGDHRKLVEHWAYGAVYRLGTSTDGDTPEEVRRAEALCGLLEADLEGIKAAYALGSGDAAYALLTSLMGGCGCAG